MDVRLPTGLARAALLAGLAAALASCANPRAERAALAQTALLGMPKEALLSCAGVPDRSASLDDLDYYTYRSERLVGDTRTSLGLVGTTGHLGVGFGFPLTEGWVETQVCEATFTIRNGIVERVVYGGTGDAGSRLSRCYDIVETCLAGVPGAPAP